MTRDLENSAEEEIKRADHLIYVTLKYTRTIDVIKSIIKRLITAYDYAIQELLEYLKIEASLMPLVRVQQIKKKRPQLKKEIDFYLFLKKLDKAAFIKKEEYRKHVTLMTKYVNVDIPVLEEYFNQTKEFVKFVREYVSKK